MNGKEKRQKKDTGNVRESLEEKRMREEGTQRS